MPEQYYQDYTRIQAFRAMLEWEGILGYTGTILKWIKDIWGVELK
jgi:hypothetical protein